MREPDPDLGHLAVAARKAGQAQCSRQRTCRLADRRVDTIGTDQPVRRPGRQTKRTACPARPCLLDTPLQSAIRIEAAGDGCGQREPRTLGLDRGNLWQRRLRLIGVNIADIPPRALRGVRCVVEHGAQVTGTGDIEAKPHGHRCTDGTAAADVPNIVVTYRIVHLVLDNHP